MISFRKIPERAGNLSKNFRRAIREGYEVWAAVTPLEFEEVPAGSGADIKVEF